MSPELVSYLNGAIKSGEVTNAQVLFSGPLSGFPFDDGSGQFDVLAQIDNATYQFDPAWPAVTNASVKLHFANERMDIYSQQGQLVNLDVGSSVHVSIDDLMGDAPLVVSIDKQAELEKMHDFFVATPLANPLADIFNVVQGQGLASANIELLIGSQFEGGASVTGKVNLLDSPLYISAPGISLEHLKGELSFNNQQINLTDATATWLGMPLTIKYTSDANAEDYRANININAQLDAQTLINHGQGILDGYLSGQSDVDIALELNFTEQGFNYRAEVESPLIGLNSSLPGVYTKSSEQVWPLRAVIQGDDISNLITANINELFYFNAILDNTQSQFTNAHFIIGEKDLGLNSQNLAVSINLAQSELLPWIDLIDQIINVAKAQPDSASPGVMPPLHEVVANINSFNVSGMQFNDFDMRLSPLNNNLQLKLNAKELRAEVFIPSGQSSQPIRINSDYLRLNFLDTESEQPSEKSTPEQLAWLTKLPAIEFECADCKVSHYQLDKVSASLLGDGKKLLISELVVDKGDIYYGLKGNGRMA
jgi:uncharacterized protein YhdP